MGTSSVEALEAEVAELRKSRESIWRELVDRNNEILTLNARIGWLKKLVRCVACCAQKHLECRDCIVTGGDGYVSYGDDYQCEDLAELVRELFEEDD